MKKVTLDKKQIIKSIKNTLLVILGTFIIALGTELFILPASLVTGGLAGIAVCFKYGEANIDSEFVITVATVLLFFLGLIFLGWRFSAKTLVSTITYPISLYLIKWIVAELDFLLIFNSPSLSGHTPIMVLLSSLFGGVLVGAGCATTFLGGGSSGGVDIVAFILCKYIKKLKSSQGIFIMDSAIVIAGFLFNPEHDFALCLEGVLSAFVAAIVIDKVFIGNSKMFVANIITDKCDEITDDIINKIDRTTTLFSVIGGYTKNDKKMIMVSFSMNEYNELVRIVYQRDRSAFMTISRAHEIKGEGFEPLGDSNEGS